MGPILQATSRVIPIKLSPHFIFNFNVILLHIVRISFLEDICISLFCGSSLSEFKHGFRNFDLDIGKIVQVFQYIYVGVTFNLS